METSTFTGEYVLIAEGGGWPELAIGPFADTEDAEVYIAANKHRESWGSVSNQPRDLPIEAPEDEDLSLACVGGLWYVNGSENLTAA